MEGELLVVQIPLDHWLSFTEARAGEELKCHFLSPPQALSGDETQLETLLGESPTSHPLKERGQT